jgi:zinc protease
VREKRGLSYDASSSFLPLAQRGPFIAGLQTAGTQAQEAREVLQQTIRDYLARGPTDEQLDLAKRNILGGFPLRIESNAKITEYVAMIGFYELPLDFLDRYQREVKELKREAVREALRRRIDVDNMVQITVGATP